MAEYRNLLGESAQVTVTRLGAWKCLQMSAGGLESRCQQGWFPQRGLHVLTTVPGEPMS